MVNSYLVECWLYFLDNLMYEKDSLHPIIYEGSLKNPDTKFYQDYKDFEKNLIDGFKGGAQVEIAWTKIKKLHQGVGMTMEYFMLLNIYNNTTGYNQTRDPEAGVANHLQIDCIA